MHKILIFFSIFSPFALHAAVTPPEVPKISRALEKEEVEKLPPLQQSPQLQQELTSLQTGTPAERIERLKRKSLADQVWFSGGTFIMGDWAKWVGKFDSRPAHEVTLTGFSMGRYKVTQAEFEVFKQSKGMQPDDEPKGPMNAPVKVTWYEAKEYCQWLGKLTAKPFDLPTEAQWEYAARSRGQKFAFSTDNGNLEKGRNLPGSLTHAEKLAGNNLDYTSHNYPVGLFPPSPMGMHDMSYNGMEWVNDWYDERYYEHSPKKDPKGPRQGKDKVTRSWPTTDDIGSWAVTLTRRNIHPDMMYPSLEDDKVLALVRGQTMVRCVVNLNKPLFIKH
ncbi:MAG: formylglycine-generating enzyme family protein [Iodobacter sp.]